MEKEESAMPVRTVRLVTPWFPSMPKRKRVAAYARVSLGTSNMLHSLSAQISYYNDYIQRNPAWAFAGIYADANVSGALMNRPEFQRLLEDCRLGKIDIIITKSVSRFARNTAVLLQTVRELKSLGVDVYFEEQNIHSLSAEGELILTFIACYAQAELENTSENIKWRKRRDMRLGIAKPARIYGYEVRDGTLVIRPEEAAVVRQIFRWYLSGLGEAEISKRLFAEGICSPSGLPSWNTSVIWYLLHNEKMRGNLMHQRSFTVDPISKKEAINRGELPMYLIHNTHKGIIDGEVFEAVQDEMERRRKIGGLHEYAGLVFRKKLVCDYCGCRFVHARAGQKSWIKPVWRCGGHDKRSHVSTQCKAKDIPEDILMAVSCEVMGIDEFDSEEFERRVLEIHVPAHHILTFEMMDGGEITKVWASKKRGIKEKGLPNQDSLPPLPKPSAIPAARSRLSEEEQMRISELRSMGYEYKRIAASLGRPVSTIRTHCIYRPSWIAAGTHGYRGQN